ncbi:hypothetical protein MHYP_G00331330 [Metynnis hypsauchen]
MARLSSCFVARLGRKLARRLTSRCGSFGFGCTKESSLSREGTRNRFSYIKFAEITSSENGRSFPTSRLSTRLNPPGFAFVEFEDPRDATDAVRELDGRTLCGCRVRVEMSSGEKRSRNRGPPPSWGRRPRDDYRRRSPPPRRRSPRRRSFSRSRSRSLSREKKRDRSLSRERRRDRSLSREKRKDRSLSRDRNHKPSRSLSRSRR